MQPGGQLTTTTEVDNWPGDVEGLTGPALMERMQQACRAVRHRDRLRPHPHRRVAAAPVRAQGRQRHLYLRCADHRHRRLRPVPRPALGRNLHRQRRIRACATCDGFFYRNQVVAVIGGGNTAVEEALYLSNIAKEVHLIHRRDKLRAEKILQDKLLDKAANGNMRLLWNHTARRSARRRQRRHRRAPRKTRQSGTEKELNLAGRVHRHRPQTQHRALRGAAGNARRLPDHPGRQRRQRHRPPIFPAYLPPAMWPITSIAKPSPRPASAAWRRSTPKNTSTTSDAVRRSLAAALLLTDADLAGSQLSRVSTRWIGAATSPTDCSRSAATCARSVCCRPTGTAVFPWYQDGQPILWWSPDPRTVLFPGRMHVSRSLAQMPAPATLLGSPSTTAFGEVMRRLRRAAPTMPTAPGSRTRCSNAYRQLHRLGIAHSVEVWQEEQLVGGLYGLAIGQLFFGESMFSQPTTPPRWRFVTSGPAIDRRGASC